MSGETIGTTLNDLVPIVLGVAVIALLAAVVARALATLRALFRPEAARALARPPRPGRLGFARLALLTAGFVLLITGASLVFHQGKRQLDGTAVVIGQPRAASQAAPAPDLPTGQAGLPPLAQKPVAPPVAAPSDAAIRRIEIPRLGVDASVIVLGVDPDGTMQSPNGPFDVGWYNFTQHPGRAGNAVFGGHLDYIRHGPAVFYRLSQLAPGDEVRIELADDTVYTYRVDYTRYYSAADAPLSEIIGPTENEVITLITCGGTFNRTTGQYDKRVVVRAERVQLQAEVN